MKVKFALSIYFEQSESPLAEDVPGPMTFDMSCDNLLWQDGEEVLEACRKTYKECVRVIKEFEQ